MCKCNRAKSRLAVLWVCFLTAAMLPFSVAAQDGSEEIAQLDNSWEPQAENATEEEYEQVEQKKAAEADSKFNTIMAPQSNVDILDNTFGGEKPARRQGNFSQEQLQLPSGPEPESRVEIPIKDFLDLRKQLLEIHKQAMKRVAPPVVLGSAEYRGEAIKGALHLRVKLQVTLGIPNKWKTVPLVGDNVVLVKATLNSQPIPISRFSGYHVWVTQNTGEAIIDMELLVPARGPRGSIEYDFLVDRTPVTRFSCWFPVSGLEPRLDAAIQSGVKEDKGGTLLEATLRPTARIHLIGYKDLGEEEGTKAEISSQSLNLLSVEEDTLNLFTVIRYAILYSGTKEFEIRIPNKDIEVISAQGKGGLQFEDPIPDDQGILLRGQTSFPIRNTYEISLHLKWKDYTKGDKPFAVPLPHPLGVKKEEGWLAVEVPGKLQLQKSGNNEFVKVKDPRQLPEEMILSSVSPILLAYQYYSDKAAVSLSAIRLPELEPASGSIDQVRAFTTVTQEGKVMTDLRITLRNRLRHSLVLTVPNDTNVLSSHLDGQKIKPSKNTQGEILLPLKRSGGVDRLQPFTISLVLESQMDPLGWFGNPKFNLPSVDLPVSSLAWSIYLPARNFYSRLKGDIEPQLYEGRATWYRSLDEYSAATDNPTAETYGASITTLDETASANTGAMPVRIKLPQDGVRLEYSRYWLEKNKPVNVSFFYAQSWLKIPAWLLLMSIMALAVGCGASRWTDRKRILPWAGGILFLLVLWPLFKLGGDLSLLLGILTGVLVVTLRKGVWKKIPAQLIDWTKNFMPRFRDWRNQQPKWQNSKFVWATLGGLGIALFGAAALNSAMKLVALLLHPL